MQLHFLTRAAVERGWRVTYVARPQEIPDRQSDIEFVPFVETNKPRRDRRMMDALLSEIEADVYYQRGRKLWTGYVGYFAKRTGAPFVYAVSMDIDCYVSKAAVRFRRDGVVSRLKRAVLARGADRISLEGMRNAALVLAQTEHQKQLLCENLDIKASVFRNVHPIPGAHLRSVNGTPTVLWLASVKRWKRPELFVEMARKLATLDARFVLAGRLVDMDLRPMLCEAAKNLPNFTYIEDVPFERSNDLMADSDVFVNTSLLEEGFPNTYIQAWLREVPTVTLGFDPDGVIAAEGLGANASGLDELCEKVAILIQEPEKRRAMGRRARDYAIDQHGLQENSDRFFGLLDRVMPGGRE